MSLERLPLVETMASSRKAASFTSAKRNAKGVMMPQTIAHRGYRAGFPENSMSSFVGAVSVGADAIETDVRLTKDGVVVLSHDVSLKRCFGRKENIGDCTWDELRELRTTQTPHVPLARLTDLLEYLAGPDAQHVWLLLDIKASEAADLQMRRIAAAIQEVPAAGRPWDERIVLGCWATKYIPLCDRYLPTFPITHIFRFSVLYARQFLALPHIGFNILQQSLMVPIGTAFLKDVRAAKRTVFVWTVNDPKWARWSIRQRVDGIITDDPKMVLEVSSAYEESGRADRLTVMEVLNLMRVQFIIICFAILFKRKFPERLARRPANKSV